MKCSRRLASLFASEIGFPVLKSVSRSTAFDAFDAIRPEVEKLRATSRIGDVDAALALDGHDLDRMRRGLVEAARTQHEWERPQREHARETAQRNAFLFEDLGRGRRPSARRAARRRASRRRSCRPRPRPFPVHAEHRIDRPMNRRARAAGRRYPAARRRRRGRLETQEALEKGLPAAARQPLERGDVEPRRAGIARRALGPHEAEVGAELRRSAERLRLPSRAARRGALPRGRSPPGQDLRSRISPAIPRNAIGQTASRRFAGPSRAARSRCSSRPRHGAGPRRARASTDLATLAFSNTPPQRSRSTKLERAHGRPSSDASGHESVTRGAEASSSANRKRSSSRPSFLTGISGARRARARAAESGSSGSSRTLRGKTSRASPITKSRSKLRPRASVASSTCTPPPLPPSGTAKCGAR